MRAANEITRRHFVSGLGLGIGGMAFDSLMARDLRRSNEDPLRVKAPHFAPRARSVIFLFMAGAPSQLDLFDDKPRLRQLSGKKIPEKVIAGERFAFIKGTPKVLGSPYAFARHGECGASVSELLPATAGIVDDLAIIRSMHTDAFNHVPAQLFLNSGTIRIGRPSMGSWVLYGLGSEARNLPGFVVMVSGGGQPSGGKSLWGSGFLPTYYQGVQFRSKGDPVLFVSDPDGMGRADRRRSLDALRDLNAMRLAEVGDPEIETRIAAYEMAFRMQASVPELMDIKGEPAAVHEMYGTRPGKVAFANNCLLARRLVERGVRFVQLYHRGWDSHGTSRGDDLLHSLPKQCRDTDRAAAALIKDLAQRGLLETTLVVWGGEFGRTPMNEARNGSKFLGRDHHPHCFSIWMAGGGIKAGLTLGATDELGYRIVEDGVHVHDLQATILHLLGFDHERLTFRSQGRDFRLTDVHGRVVEKLLA